MAKWKCNGCGAEEEAEKRPTACKKCGDTDAEAYDPSTLKPGTVFSPAPPPGAVADKPVKPARKKK